MRAATRVALARAVRSPCQVFPHFEISGHAVGQTSAAAGYDTMQGAIDAAKGVYDAAARSPLVMIIFVADQFAIVCHPG